MSQDTQQQQMSKKRVVYTMPGVDAVKVRRDEAYRATDAGTHTIDLYYPPDSTTEIRTPAVIFVTGFSDLGAQKLLGLMFQSGWTTISIIFPRRPAGTPANVRDCHCGWAAKYVVAVALARFCQ